jgi:hypothetical protein
MAEERVWKDVFDYSNSILSGFGKMGSRLNSMEDAKRVMVRQAWLVSKVEPREPSRNQLHG